MVWFPRFKSIEPPRRYKPAAADDVGNPDSRLCVYGPVTPEFTTMPRFLPHYLIFVVAHVLIIAAVIAVAALS